MGRRVSRVQVQQTRLVSSTWNSAGSDIGFHQPPAFVAVVEKSGDDIIAHTLIIVCFRVCDTLVLVPVSCVHPSLAIGFMH